MEAKHIQAGKYYRIAYTNPKLQWEQFRDGAKVILYEVHESGLRGLFKLQNSDSYREIDFIDVQNWEQEMEEQLMLGGMSLDVVKAKFQAIDKQRQELNNMILKDSVKFVSDSIVSLKDLLKKVIACETKLAAERLAKQANELCNLINNVSTLTGVKYSLPHSGNGYCEGDTEGEDGVFSQILEGLDFISYKNWEGAVCELIDNLRDMESSVQQWNSSYC